MRFSTPGLGALLGAVFGLVLASALAAQSQVSQVRQHGITWTFSQPTLAGRYVNGDWWVLAPATVTSVSPAPSGSRNGSMLNPRAGDELRRTGQGYDSRIGYHSSSAAARFPLALRAGDTLVSTISRPDNTKRQAIWGNVTSHGVLRTAAVLTAVGQPPAADAFRPSYCGPKQSFRESQLRWGRLPGLALPASAPDPKAYARYFQRPWLDHLLGYESRMLHPYENMPDYGREISILVGEGGLLLLGNRSRAELRDLMVNYVQLGIDLYGILQDGHRWWADGGHMNGRKWPIMFAGFMLGHPGMKSPGNAFSEDEQTDGELTWTGARTMFRMRSSDDHEERHPTRWDATDVKYEKYRRCCTSYAYLGSALCALAMDATDEWNHPAFFRYVERWMTPMHPADRADTLAAVGSTVTTFPHEYVGSAFVADMWRKHRNNLLPDGVTMVGKSSSYPIRIAVFDEPEPLKPFDIYVSNAPITVGSWMAAPGVGPPQSILNATMLLSGGPPPVSVPFVADSRGKAVIRLVMPPLPPGLQSMSFALQLGWLDIRKPLVESSPALVIDLR